MAELSESVIDLNSLIGAKRKRAYQKLRYRKRSLELGQRGSGIKCLQKEILILEAKASNPEAKTCDLLLSKGFPYNQIVKQHISRIKPHLDSILELMDGDTAKVFINILKDKAHEQILNESSIDDKT